MRGNPANEPQKIHNRNNQNLQANRQRPNRRQPNGGQLGEGQEGEGQDPFADLYQDPDFVKPKNKNNQNGRRNRNNRLGRRRFPFLLGYGGYGYGGYGYGGYGFW